MKIKKCPVCKSDLIDKIFNYKNYSLFNVPIIPSVKNKLIAGYEKNELNNNLSVGGCNNCGHIFLINLPNIELISILYKDCYNVPYPILSECSSDREDYFLELFNNHMNSGIINKANSNSVLEIGGGDQYILYKLKQDGFKVLGCDPSVRAAEIANSFGINVIIDEFEKNYFINNNLSFDIIILRNMLEHIPDPINLIKDISTILNYNGLIMIEVPDVEDHLIKGMVEGFHFQHYQYFSEKSIRHAINEIECDVIDLVKAEGNLYVTLSNSQSHLINDISEHINKSIDQNLESFNNILKTNYRLLHTRIEQEKKIGNKIVLWGAGGACYSVLKCYELNCNDIDFLLDSNKDKQSMEFIDNELSISSPDIIIGQNINCIIITSMFYKGICDYIKSNRLANSAIIFDPLAREIDLK